MKEILYFYFSNLVYRVNYFFFLKYNKYDIDTTF